MTVFIDVCHDMNVNKHIFYLLYVLVYLEKSPLVIKSRILFDIEEQKLQRKEINLNIRRGSIKTRE